MKVEPGARIGPYEILLCVGRGGMASVWAARQHGARGFNRLVALKTVLPDLAAPDLDGMFLDEARVTARIHHPNVCEVFELIEYQGVLALSMEWVDGDTLNNLLNGRAKSSALEPRVAAQIIAHVAHGLHAAHELRDERDTPLQLVHRDISPQNILISRAGHVKVTDFGVAKSLDGAREATAVGKVKGKLSYMSPEQAQGKLIDRRSDIFSLGVVLYLATVGSHPFRRTGESRHQQLSRLVRNRIKPPSELVSGYPRELEAIVMRALSREVGQRFQSAHEMAQALQDWVLASGALVTEQHIARVVLERSGPGILQRSERIANLMCKGREERVSEEPLPAAADPTLVPTTTRAGHAVPPERARGRATLRVVSTTLTAAALGLAATFVFATPGGLPRFGLGAPSDAPLTAPDKPSVTAADVPAPPRAPSSEAPPRRAPEVVAPAPTPTVAPPADVQPPRATHPEPAPAPRARAVTKKRSVEASKTRKPSPVPKRRRAPRSPELSGIRSGR